MAYPIVRAAVVQAAPMVFDTPRALANLIDLTRDAAAQRAGIVVFPRRLSGAIRRGSISVPVSACAAPRVGRISAAIMTARLPCPG
jgi:hypothetical protein